MKKSFFTIIFFLVAFQFSFAQYNIPKKPKFQTSVYDYYIKKKGVKEQKGLLTLNEKTALENKLVRYSDTTSTQIVVAIINSTKGEEIGYLATNWAHKWGIGQKDKDNGVFVLLAKDDRKVTIRTGYGTEHLLTDFVSRQIIEYDILPYFKKGQYYSGLSSGVTSIFKVMNGEYQGTRKKNSSSNAGVIIIVIVIFFSLFIFIGYKAYRIETGRSTSSLETIILSNAGREDRSRRRGSSRRSGGFGGFGGSSGGFGGGGFDGGGFGGGFGGGGFGGGGATGGW
ncbi:TPM domain-containing protein [Tenacibaculum jejuense]|uniref:TPM domain-containing protein n=1 Tax=Tenacibaculum jejuense TaxID=584609 RepID=A0A238U7M5_9FLAO|nr:TPM domain-containing protein [Tenacibaculum jejuense]SNR14390.1 conserved exported protein of unknown function [Tenacibaculum jejuense]